MRIFIIIYIKVIAKHKTKQNYDTGVSLQQLESNAVKIKRKVKRCITWLSKLSCLGENRKQPTFYDATSRSPAK